MSLFTEEERWEMYRATQAKLNAERRKQLAMMPPKPKKADILVEVAQEFAPCTVAELADASGMSQSWVRRHLRAAGIVLAKPVRRGKEVKG
jgi:DNA-binding transcriptional ArsR family regulator